MELGETTNKNKTRGQGNEDYDRKEGKVETVDDREDIERFAMTSETSRPALQRKQQGNWYSPENSC